MEDQTKKLKTALKKIAKATPEDGEVVINYIEKLRERNITILGDNELLNLRDPDGEIRAFQRVVRLSVTDGTLVQPTPGSPYVISAQGYERLNQETGTLVMNADSVLVDGVSQQNPHVVRDIYNGRILMIYSRSIAFRYSPLGIPQVSDRTTIYDVPAYRLIDLISKAKKYPQAFRLLPSDCIPDNDGTWAKYVFDESTLLWINTSHDEALSFYAQIINREKKAIDLAQTFSQRNAAKHLYGIQKAPGPEWSLPVICWRPLNEGPLRWDVARYMDAKKMLTNVAEGKTHGKLPDIELTHGIDYINEETSHVEADIPEEEETHEQAPYQDDHGIQDTEPMSGMPEEYQAAERQSPGDPIWKQFDAAPPELIDMAIEALGMEANVETVVKAKLVLTRASEIADGGQS